MNRTYYVHFESNKVHNMPVVAFWCAPYLCPLFLCVLFLAPPCFTSRCGGSQERDEWHNAIATNLELLRTAPGTTEAMIAAVASNTGPGKLFDAREVGTGTGYIACRVCTSRPTLTASAGCSLASSRWRCERGSIPASTPTARIHSHGLSWTWQWATNRAPSTCLALTRFSSNQPVEQRCC